MNDMLSFIQNASTNCDAEKASSVAQEAKIEFRCPKCRNTHYRTAKMQSIPTSFSKDNSGIIRFNVYICTSCGFTEMYAE